MAAEDGLDRFVAAQAGVYDQALAELEAGRKRTHWMWFVFPQIAGLGHSAMARHYAIASRREAAAYLAHPLLGSRLVACTAAVLRHRGTPADLIFGDVDAVKFRSSMTLFEAAAVENEPLFGTALESFHRGKRDPRTLELLG
jgi:uncharacterized protein (DUF1810 family)